MSESDSDTTHRDRFLNGDFPTGHDLDFEMDILFLDMKDKDPYDPELDNVHLEEMEQGSRRLSESRKLSESGMPRAISTSRTWTWQRY